MTCGVREGERERDGEKERRREREREGRYEEQDARGWGGERAIKKRDNRMADK